MKRTSDDLRTTVENFPELLAVLRDEVKSPCLVEQLTTASPGVSLPPCPLPPRWQRSPPPVWRQDGTANATRTRR